MDFREGYKNSAESLSPDKQTVERMKAAVHARLNEPKKAFPYKRIAYIGGTVAACLVIGVIGITALTGRDTAGITETAQNDTNSSYAISADTDAAAEEMAAESMAATTTAPTTTAIVLDVPKMYDEFPEDAALESFDEAEEPIIDSSFDDSAEIEENIAKLPDEPMSEDNFAPDAEPEFEPEFAPTAPSAPTEQPDFEPEPDAPSVESEEEPVADACLILFSEDMESCTLLGADYHRTEDPIEVEEFESVLITTESGVLGEAILMFENTSVIVYIDGEYIGSYIIE